MTSTIEVGRALSAEHASCSICGNAKGNTKLVFAEKMFRMGAEFEYVDCGECHAITLIDPPADFSSYYPKGRYYSVLPKTRLRRFLRLLRDLAYIKAYPFSRLVRRHLPNAALESTLSAARDLNARILDVGCGDGTLLIALSKLGMNNLTGVDPLITKEVQEDRIRFISGELSEVRGSFDVITFHHSLEHLVRPAAALRQARALLADGGKIVVRIPSRDSLAYMIYGENWFQIDAPRHLCLHSHKSIAAVAAKAGLKVTSIQCDSTAMQFWASDLYRNNLELGAPAQRGYRKSRRRFYRELADFANRNRVGDQIVVHMTAA